MAESVTPCHAHDSVHSNGKTNEKKYLDGRTRVCTASNIFKLVLKVPSLTLQNRISIVPNLQWQTNYIHQIEMSERILD
jgi:hypothetical protein